MGEMNFGEALKHIKDGRAVRRLGWNGNGMWVALLPPDHDSDMTLPYIYLRTAQGQYVPWLSSQTDLLAEDWVKA